MDKSKWTNDDVHRLEDFAKYVCHIDPPLSERAFDGMEELAESYGLSIPAYLDFLALEYNLRERDAIDRLNSYIKHPQKYEHNR